MAVGVDETHGLERNEPSSIAKSTQPYGPSRSLPHFPPSENRLILPLNQNPLRRPQIDSEGVSQSVTYATR